MSEIDEALQITERLLRLLYAYTGENPVIYLEDTGDDLLLDVWAEALAPGGAVVFRLHELIDFIGEEPDSATIEEYLPQLQETVDQRVGAYRS